MFWKVDSSDVIQQILERKRICFVNIAYSYTAYFLCESHAEATIQYNNLARWDEKKTPSMVNYNNDKTDLEKKI
jgi:hypothetical protein